MSEQWLGLHNHERHRPVAYDETHCTLCREYCDPRGGASYCRCCLMEERTILTTANEVLRAQVARVREVHDLYSRLAAPYAPSLIRDLRDALDGDE